MNKEQKLSIFFFILAILFVLLAIWKLYSDDGSSMGAAFLCFSSTFLFFGTTHAARAKKDNDTKEKQD